MPEQKITLGTPGTYTLLEGKTLELKQPEKILLNGNIESVSQFLTKRYKGRVGKGLQEVDKDKATVTVDEVKMYIHLYLDPENHFGTKVQAQLEASDELKQFQINSTVQFDRNQLVKLLKFNKRFFDSPDQYDKVYDSYMRLNLQTNVNLKNESDDRGNKDVAFKKQITTQVPHEFILNIPIFKGQPKERFRVEICLDVTDASVRFWFESVELTELSETRVKEIFAKELQYCEDFVIIHK